MKKAKKVKKEKLQISFKNGKLTTDDPIVMVQLATMLEGLSELSKSYKSRIESLLNNEVNVNVTYDIAPK